MKLKLFIITFWAVGNCFAADEKRVYKKEYTNEQKLLCQRASRWFQHEPNLNWLRDSVKCTVKIGIHPDDIRSRHCTILSFYITELNTSPTQADLDFIELLLKNGADPNQLVTESEFAQHLIFCVRHVSIAQLFVKYGVDVTVKDKWNRSILFNVALSNYDVGLIDLYIQHGADIDAVSKAGLTALTNLISLSINGFVANNNYDLIFKKAVALIRHGVPLDIDNTYINQQAFRGWVNGEGHPEVRWDKIINDRISKAAPYPQVQSSLKILKHVIETEIKKRAKAYAMLNEISPLPTVLIAMTMAYVSSDKMSSEK